MIIEGVSQSTGVERRVEVTSSPTGIRVAIRDRKLGTVLAFIIAPADSLMSVLTEQPTGSQTIADQTGGSASELTMEVRRNEILLAIGAMDAAVGLDDLIDAIAKFSSFQFTS